MLALDPPSRHQLMRGTPPEHPEAPGDTQERREDTPGRASRDCGRRDMKGELGGSDRTHPPRAQTAHHEGGVAHCANGAEAGTDDGDGTALHEKNASRGARRISDRTQCPDL